MARGWPHITEWIGIKDRTYAVIDQAAVSAANLLTTVIIGRACSKEELGLYAIGFGIITLSFCAQRALVLTPYTVQIPSLGDDERVVFKGSTLIQNGLLTAVIALAILIATGATSAITTSNRLGSMLGALTAVICFILFREYARLTSIAERHYLRAVALDLFVVAAQLVSILTLAALGNLTSRSAFLAVGSAAAVGSVLWLIIERKSIRISWSLFLPHLGRNWYFGRWLFGSGLLSQLGVSLYPWILMAYHGAAESGAWAACVGVVALYNPVMLAMYNEAGPRISHDFASGGVTTLRRSVLRTAVVCGLATAPFLLILLLFGGRLVTLLYGAEFSGAESTVRALATGSFVLSCSFAFPYGLLALRRPGLDFAGNAISTLILLTLGWWLAAIFGTLGAAMGVLLGYTAAESAKAFGFVSAVAKAKP